MDDLDIILPCGFSRKFKDIFHHRESFTCSDCISHEISKEDCLNIPRNKLIINQKIFELKLTKFADRIEQLEMFKANPKYYNDESYTKIKNNICLRKEEIKFNFNKKIDEYFENLEKQIENERESNYVVAYDRLEQILLFEQEISNFDIDQNLKIDSKIELIKNYKNKIDIGTHFVEKTIDKFHEANLKLLESDDCIDISRLFGELYIEPETNLISYGNGEDIDDNSRESATYQFVVNNFSKCKKSKNLKLTSKSFIIRNFEWNIVVEFDENSLCCYVVCNPVLETPEWYIDAELDIILINKIDSEINLEKKWESFIFRSNLSKHEFDNFINFEDMMIDGKNCFLDYENDSITFEVRIKAQLPYDVYFNNFCLRKIIKTKRR